MDTRCTLPANLILNDCYRIERVVGSGRFGVTYEASDLALGTTVALKEYYPAEFGDRDDTLSVRPKSQRNLNTFERGRSDFLAEARTLARFEHPSIVRVVRVFEANTTAYMVMRFERGQNLEDWLRSLGRLPTQDELDALVAPLLDALEMMHGANFLHRDIAPDNIIVREDGTPVLLDFGAARRAVAAMSRTMTGVVKAGYSPHEQYSSDGRLQGPWSDLYALGATLYRAVMGRPPEESALRVTDDRMTPASRLAAKDRYRPGFLAGIDACLKVRHAERPRSVAHVRAMLFGHALPHRREAEPIISKPRATSRPAARPAGRARTSAFSARWLAVVAAGLALLGGIYGGLEFARWTPALPDKAAADNARSLVETEARRQAAEAARRHIALEEERQRREAADAAERRASLDADRKGLEEAEPPAAEEGQGTTTDAEVAGRRKEGAESAQTTSVPLGADARAGFVKRVQAVLKQSRCYEGAIDGRSAETQPDLDRYVSGFAAGKKAKPPARLELAKATAGDFESWLRDADAVKGDICAPKPKPAKVEQAKPLRPRETEEAEPRRQAAAKPQGSASGHDRPGRGGTCSGWMFGNTSCTDSAGRRCTQTYGGRKCE